MTRNTYKAAFAAAAALTLSVLGAGCSHQAGGGDALAQQKAGVMGAPAPPEVQAQIAAQMEKQKAAQEAAQQAGQQAAQQAAAQQGQATK